MSFPWLVPHFPWLQIQTMNRLLWQFQTNCYYKNSQFGNVLYMNKWCNLFKKLWITQYFKTRGPKSYNCTPEYLNLKWNTSVRKTQLRRCCKLSSCWVIVSTKMAILPLIGWDIFNFLSATFELILMWNSKGSYDCKTLIFRVTLFSWDQHTANIKTLFSRFVVSCSIIHTSYCKLVIIRHVPIFAIFVSAFNDEFTYWRI